MMTTFIAFSGVDWESSLEQLVLSGRCALRLIEGAKP